MTLVTPQALDSRMRVRMHKNNGISKPAFLDRLYITFSRYVKIRHYK